MEEVNYPKLELGPVVLNKVLDYLNDDRERNKGSQDLCLDRPCQKLAGP